MHNNAQDINQDCEVCYKIICKSCGWIASDEETLKVYKKEITSCPLCGWIPD